MKKVILALAAVALIMAVNSCTTDSTEEIENNYKAIDKGTPPPTNGIDKGTPPPKNG